MKIIVGLGNPGLRYKNTRHNAGFMAIKVLAKKHKIAVKKKGFQGVYGIGRIKQQEVMLFEPLTYMNLSGEAVAAVCSSKLENENDLLVISDDFNLTLGNIRLRQKGSAGGHNGLQSIIERIGPDFARLRAGVTSGEAICDKTDNSNKDMSSYVLSPFPRADRAILTETFDKMVNACEIWLTQGIREAMNRFN